MGLLLVYLEFILVPLVMAVFFSYFLQPIVDLLSVRPIHCCGNETLCASYCGDPPARFEGYDDEGSADTPQGLAVLDVKPIGSDGSAHSGDTTWVALKLYLYSFV